MRWTKAPLTDDDFAQIRSNVMAKIETPRRSSLASRWAYAAVIAGCLLIARVVSEKPVAPPRNAHVHAGRSAGFQPAPVSRPEAGGPAERSSAVPEALPKAVTAKKHEPAPSPMRIEIQTSDPDVRIIWIANQTPETEHPQEKS